MAKQTHTLEQVFFMTGFCEQFLFNARQHVGYRDNLPSSRDAESILWACERVVRAERQGDTRYANFLTQQLSNGSL
jgi:hypothetical protein